MRPFSIGLFVLLIVLLGLPPVPQVQAQTAPSGFSDTLVVNVTQPTALAFTPDGSMLVGSQLGKLFIYNNSTMTETLDLGPDLCTNSERGLLGIAVDPAFTTNRFIYLFYTFNQAGVCGRNNAQSPVNRVSRFMLPANNQIDRSSETILIDNMPSPNGNHNAGDLHFGKDGYLYISIGDGGCDYAGNSGCAGNNDAARDRHVLTGKILRITRDGGIPPDNPFQGPNTGRCNLTGRTTAGWHCQETFAWGLRNPFRLAFDPDAATTRFFINDVGQNVWEEINEGVAGADYGWNTREGFCANNSTTNCGAPPTGMTNPIFAYSHSERGCASITGGAFVPRGVWPGFDGSYLYGDYVCGTIFVLRPVGGGYNAEPFIEALGLNSAVTLIFGPHAGSQALYYTTYSAGGSVRRVAFAGNTNRAPVAVAAANPQAGPAPLVVQFNANGSSDPDGDPLSYQWIFGDGTSGSGQTVTHTYTRTGIFTASLTVSDGRGETSAPATLRIDAGNTPPVPVIEAPTASTRYAVGERLVLRGNATDAQDGTLSGTRLTWRALIHHNEHTHPYLPPTTGSEVALEAPAPEDLAATATSWLEIELTATDSAGLTGRTVLRLDPQTVSVTLQSDPSGLALIVNGEQIVTPYTLLSWQGYTLNLSAQPQTNTAGQVLLPTGWSDGFSTITRTITTPNAPVTYTARFAPGSTTTATRTSTATRTPTLPPEQTITSTPTSTSGGTASSATPTLALTSIPGSVTPTSTATTSDETNTTSPTPTLAATGIPDSPTPTSTATTGGGTGGTSPTATRPAGEAPGPGNNRRWIFFAMMLR